MSSQGKPSIVFVHGLRADGSCFSKLIPTLLDEGFEVIASQHGLDSHAGAIHVGVGGGNVFYQIRRTLHGHSGCRGADLQPVIEIDRHRGS